VNGAPEEQSGEGDAGAGVAPAAEHHRHVFVEAGGDDWAWRRKIRSSPTLAVPYRIVVLVVGLVITVGGLILVPLPGPGWLIVFFGIAVLASEFEPAQRLLDRGKGILRGWTEWTQRQPRWGQGLIGLLTAAFVLAVIWAVFKVSGLPGFTPEAVAGWLHDHAGL
jgi:uncharacterized protein (TIGR02611 family)